MVKAILAAWFLAMGLFGLWKGIKGIGPAIKRAEKLKVDEEILLAFPLILIGVGIGSLIMAVLVIVMPPK